MLTGKASVPAAGDAAGAPAQAPGAALTGPARSLPTLLSRRAIGVTHRYGWLILSCTIVAMLLEIADQMIVSTAMPRIITDLSGFNQFAWVTTAYLLGSTITMPLYGKLADLYEAKWVFLFGLLLFVGASALCGAAQDMTQLILLRALQGIGGGALPPVGMVILTSFVTPERRPAMQGSASVMVLAATVAGPIVGGGISDLGPHSWRWVFLINVPLGLIAALLLALLLPRLRIRHDGARIDYLGAVLLALSAVPFLLIAKLPARDRSVLGAGNVLPLLIAGLVILALFIVHELRHPEPIFDPRLLKTRLYAVTTGANTLLSATTFACLAYIPLYVQGVFGHSATRGGLVLAPLMLSSITGRLAVSWLRRHHGHIQALTLGCLALNVAGAAALVLLGPDSWGAQVVLAMLLLGAGLGASSALLFAAALSPFSSRQFGQATGTLFFLRSMGGAIIIAALGSVLASRFLSAIVTELPARYHWLWKTKLAVWLRDPRLALAHLPTTPGHHPVRDAILRATHEALATSLHDVFVIILGLTVVAFGALATFPVRLTRQQELETAEAAERGLAGFGEVAATTERAALTPERASAAWDIVWHVLYWRYRTTREAPKRRAAPVFNTFDEQAPHTTSLDDAQVVAAFERAWASLRERTTLDRYRAESVVGLLWRVRAVEGDVAVCGGAGDAALAELLALVVAELELPKQVIFYHSAGNDATPAESQPDATPPGNGAGQPAEAEAARRSHGAAITAQGLVVARMSALEPERQLCLAHLSGDSQDAVATWLERLLPLASRNAVVVIGHYHSGRDGARRAVAERLPGYSARLYAGPLPQAYFFSDTQYLPQPQLFNDARRSPESHPEAVSSLDGGEIDEIDEIDAVGWSALATNAAYHHFLRWVRDEVEQCFVGQSARDTYIAAALEKMGLPERADLYLGRVIEEIYGGA